jgi:hypothetical protein
MRASLPPLNRYTLRLGTAALAATLPLASLAGDLSSVDRLTQSQFRLMSEDLGAALSFKPLVPAEPLGTTGFDLGVAVTATDLKNPGLLSLATNGSSIPSYVPVPSIRLHKGLPFNIDVGLSYSALPSTNIKLWGGELRWAVLEGNTALPAIAVRGAYNASSGVDQLKLRTASADVSISKGIAMFTPYAGVGQVWVKSTPQGVPTLSEESFTQGKVFVGMNINLGVNVAVEADKTGGITSIGAKVGFRF